MNKQEIISKMSELAQGTKVDAERYLTAYLGTLEYAIENKEELKLVGYFTMEVVESASRTGRNPRSGEEIQIPAKNAIKTTIGKKLKQLAL